MAKHDLGPLGVVDTLTDKELRESLGHHFDYAMRDWYRGVDYMAFAGPGNGTATLTISGPDSGYSWSIKLVSVQLSTSGTLSVYAGDSNNSAPIGNIASVANGGNNEAVYRWGSNQAVIKDQRNLTLFAGSSVILNFRVMVKQVPTEMQGKL